MWDHRPTADELLQARLSAGWAPTPTGTVEGDKILGYAACLVPGSGSDTEAKPS